MRLFKPDGPIFTIGEKLFDIMAVSMLWAVCCIPIVTIGPATGALYYVAVKQVRKDNGTLLRNFFGSFRDSLRVGIPLTCIVLLYITAVAAGIWWLGGMSNGGTGDYLLFGVKLLLLPPLLILPYLSPILSRFAMSTGNILKLSFVMSLRFLWRTVLLLALIAGTIFLLRLFPYGLFILPGLSALLCSFLIEPALRKYTPEPDADEPTPWYWE